MGVGEKRFDKRYRNSLGDVFCAIFAPDASARREIKTSPQHTVKIYIIYQMQQINQI
jgi:hypothetical protein